MEFEEKSISFTPPNLVGNKGSFRSGEAIRPITEQYGIAFVVMRVKLQDQPCKSGWMGSRFPSN